MYLINLLLSFFAGAVLGTLFFGGLWWTVKKIAAGGSTHLLAAASFLIRAAVVMGGFYLLLEAGWHYVLAALAGFIAARIIIFVKLKPGPEQCQQGPAPKGGL